MAAAARLDKLVAALASRPDQVGPGDLRKAHSDTIGLCDIWSSIAHHAYKLNRIGEATSALHCLKPLLSFLEMTSEHIQAAIQMSPECVGMRFAQADHLSTHAKFFAVSLACSQADDARAEKLLLERMTSDAAAHVMPRELVALARLLHRVGRVKEATY